MARTSLGKLLNLVEETTTEAPIEKQFVQDLTYSIEQNAGKEKHKPSKTFKPSSIGGCERKIYYLLTDAPKDPQGHASSCNVGILESGTDRHERLQKAICDMRETGLDCDYVDVAEFVKEHGLDYIKIVKKQGMETKCLWEEIPLSFLTDGIIRYKGRYYILEIKTMNNRKFIDSKDTRPEHKAQGICYSAAFKIDDVIYLYEDRDTLMKKAFLFHVTEDMRQKLLGKTVRIKECVKSGIPPEAFPNTSKCRYCEYKQICKETK